MVTMFSILYFIFCNICIIYASMYSRYDELPFRLHQVPYSTIHPQPFTLDYHMTRYTFTHYSHLIPWIRQFDLLLTHLNNGGNSEVFSFDAKQKLISTNRTLRIHVHSDPRHHTYFLEAILPFFEYRYENSKQGIAVFSGGGDASIGIDVAEKMLSYKCVFYWRIEQNGIPWSHIDSSLDNRIMEIPIGIHWHQSITEGAKLRVNIANNSDSDILQLDPKYLEYHEFQRNLQQSVAISRNKNWSDRSDRILVCFGHRDNREAFISWAIHNCTICDVCEREGQIAYFHVEDLWNMYGRYKFILSPHGNGLECGRTWEIMLMGAIPIIHFFPGVRGYEQGNLSVIVIVNETAITVANQQVWIKEHTKPNELYKLSRDYWIKRAFTFNDTGPVDS